MKCMKRAYKEIVRDDTAFALLMIDVDEFKPYNDNYGHAAGDGCLIAIAKVLKKSLKRPSDLIARYGGEEFIVLLKDIDLEGAKQVSANLVTAVPERLNLLEYSSVSDHVTISIGLAYKTGGRVNKESLLKKADDALYKAKSEGAQSQYPLRISTLSCTQILTQIRELCRLKNLNRVLPDATLLRFLSSRFSPRNVLFSPFRA